MAPAVAARETDPREGEAASMQRPVEDAIVDCGWGRLLFAQTFADAKVLAEALRDEGPDRRDIAVYVDDPHVLLAQAPLELFLDPSHMFRLDLDTYEPSPRGQRAFHVRRLADAPGHRGGQPHLCSAPHGLGAARLLRAREGRRGAGPSRRRGRAHPRDHRHGDGRRSRRGLRRPGARLVALVPRGRSAGAPSGHRRDAGAAACGAFPGARRALHGPLRDARQRSRDRALREARLRAAYRSSR